MAFSNSPPAASACWMRWRLFDALFLVRDALRKPQGRDPITAWWKAEEPPEREQAPHHQARVADLPFWRSATLRQHSTMSCVGNCRQGIRLVCSWDHLAGDSITLVGFAVDVEDQRIRLEERRGFPK